MASASGKKKNKTNWKTVGQNDIIQISSGRSCSWADEMENQVEDNYDSKALVLPTAPRASCMVAVDESKVPLAPPFQAHVSNIPYDLTEQELRDLFPDSQVKEVRIPKEERGNRARGYGYVEFEDRSSLLTALHLGEAYVKGRSVRIELATGDSGRGGRGGRPNQRNDSGPAGSPSVDRTAGNWRSGPREEPEERERGFDRGRRDFGQGGFRREEGGFQDRERREERFPPRDRERFREDRGGRFSEDWAGRDTRDQDRRYARREEGAPPRESESKNRPRLQLQPRSTNLPSEPVPSGSASIFGNAKPVDTSAKLREIEERLAKTELSDKSRSGGSSSGSSGGAPPRPPGDKRLEPAQPPKENPWTKSRLPQQDKRPRPEEPKDI